MNSLKLSGSILGGITGTGSGYWSWQMIWFFLNFSL